MLVAAVDDTVDEGVMIQLARRLNPVPLFGNDELRLSWLHLCCSGSSTTNGRRFAAVIAGVRLHCDDTSLTAVEAEDDGSGGGGGGGGRGDRVAAATTGAAEAEATSIGRISNLIKLLNELFFTAAAGGGTGTGGDNAAKSTHSVCSPSTMDGGDDDGCGDGGAKGTTIGSITTTDVFVVSVSCLPSSDIIVFVGNDSLPSSPGFIET